MLFLPSHYPSHLTYTADPNDTTTYNSNTGDGAIGVEFAGTAVTSPSSFGAGISPSAADVISTELLNLTGNEDLQWTEASYRGFFTISVGAETLSATYYAMTNICASSVLYNSFSSCVVLSGAKAAH